jgi:ribosomal-protein-alanine N-acetyltransferase
MDAHSFSGAGLAQPDGLELRLLCPELAGPLGEFFRALAQAPDHAFFHPHPLTDDQARRLCSHKGRDLYYVACSAGRVLAYGMLRGWDEGYDIPSLGMAVHPEARGRGLARTLMVFLHMAARLRGARKIRLTVYRDNQRAVELYRRLGYAYTEKDPRQLVGILEL